MYFAGGFLGLVFHFGLCMFVGYSSFFYGLVFTHYHVYFLFIRLFTLGWFLALNYGYFFIYLSFFSDLFFLLWFAFIYCLFVFLFQAVFFSLYILFICFYSSLYFGLVCILYYIYLLFIRLFFFLFFVYFCVCDGNHNVSGEYLFCGFVYLSFYSFIYVCAVVMRYGSRIFIIRFFIYLFVLLFVRRVR